MTSLSHHGTKGMKWGVRRAEKRWNKEINNLNSGTRSTLAFHNETVSRVNRAVDDLNRSDKYRNVDMNTAHGKLKNQYEKDANEAIMRSFEDAVRSHYGYSPSGTKRAVYNRKTDQIDIVDVTPAPVAVQHAAMPKVTAPNITLQLHRNAKGLIGSVSIVPLQHMDAYAEAVLAHFGVKGMKWGVRKDSSSGHSSGGTSAPHHASSEDAAKAAAAGHKARTSGTHTLSNQELQHLVNRMNLEQQYTRLSSNTKRTNAGSKFAKEILLNVAKQQVTKLAADTVAKQVGKALK